MKIIVVSGFLGVGKTTVIKNIISKWPSEQKLSVLVNEYGKVGYDKKRLAGNKYDIKEIASGCICCSLKPKLVSSIKNIYNQLTPDTLLIEPTGLASPGQILEVINKPPIKDFAYMGPNISVIDASNFLQTYNISGAFFENQIKVADILIINKLDLVEEDEIQKLINVLKKINPHAKLKLTKQGHISKKFIDYLVNKNTTEIANYDNKHYFPDVKSISVKLDDIIRLEELKKTVVNWTSQYDIYRIKGTILIEEQLIDIDWSKGNKSLSANISKQEINEHTENNLILIGKGINEDTFSL